MCFLDEGDFLLRGQLITGGFEFLVKILKLLARVGLVLGEVEGATGGDTLQLLGTEGKLEEDVHAGPRIVGEIRFGLPDFSEGLLTQTDAGVVGDALCIPVAVPQLPSPVGLWDAEIGTFTPSSHRAMNELHGLIGLDKELQLHLLEFTRAEGKVLGRHFVAEGFADLGNTEGNLHTRRVADILELGKDRLCRLRTQIGNIILRGCRPDVGLEHQVEGTGLVEQPSGLGMKLD